MKMTLFALPIILSHAAFAESHTYNCDSKDILSGQMILGTGQHVIVDESSFTASFSQKNYSPQAVWKKVADLSADKFHALPNRFATENSDIVFYRGTIAYVQDGQIVEKIDGDGVLMIRLQNREPRSFLCKLEKS